MRPERKRSDNLRWNDDLIRAARHAARDPCLAASSRVGGGKQRGGEGDRPPVGGSGASRKLWRRAQDGLCPTPVSHCVNLWETETDCEQAVLLAHRPAAGKAKALAQPQHRFKPLDGPPGRVEGLEAANPRHGPLDPKVVTLDPLLEVLGDVMHRVRARSPSLRAAVMAGG